MRAIDAHLILDEVASLWHGGNELSSDEFPKVRGMFARRLRHIWESEWWPQIMRTQERQFRISYNALTAYSVAGTELYYPATRKYYQYLRATSATGQAPADAAGVTNAAYWADCATAYAGANYDNARAYVVGNRAFYPGTLRYYQRHTAGSGNLPTDTAFWGVLTPFDQYIDFTQSWEADAIGEAKDATNANLAVTQSYRGYTIGKSYHGIQVREAAATVWLTFRLRAPMLRGARFDSTVDYAVDDQMYFTTPSGRGNFYDAIVDPAVGESPVTAPTKWRLVEIPYEFYGYLTYGIMADCLRVDRQFEKVPDMERMAEASAAMIADKLWRQENLAPSMAVQTY